MTGRLRGVLLGLVLALTLAGCVAVPTQGPVEKVEGQQPTCQNCVNVDVAPPSDTADPLQIVQGYLRANSNYQPNFSVAKLYLTKAAAQSWSPEDGASIYTGTLTGSDDKVVLDATVTRTGRTRRGTGSRASTSDWSKRTGSGGSASRRPGCWSSSTRSRPSTSRTTCISSAAAECSSPTRSICRACGASPRRPRC
jgi:hypothetical protein